MKGAFYIDGNDAYLGFGLMITRSGYDELLAYPSLKPVDFNDWPEEDGIEADLSAPVLDTKELSLTFAVIGRSKNGSFIEMLSDKSYHEFDLRDIGRKYTLRLVSQPELKLYTGGETFSLRFADDFPLKDYQYQPPVSQVRRISGYKLDGRDLSEYGIVIEEGTRSELLKSPPVKRNLLQSPGTVSGAVYDGNFVVFQAKEAALKCVMCASDTEAFRRNRDALLYDLTRPGERILYTDYTGEEYPCHYGKCTNAELMKSGNEIRFRFSLILVFTSFRLTGEKYVLSAEDSVQIVSEDGETYIDMQIYNS